MKKTAAILLVLIFAGAAALSAATNYRKLNLKRRFLSGVWRNIGHLNSARKGFGSLGERHTAGVRGSKSNSYTTPTVPPTRQEVLKKIDLMEKMLFQENIKKPDRIRALYYLGACHLFLGQPDKARIYYDRLYRYAPDNLLTAQLRKDIATAGGK